MKPITITIQPCKEPVTIIFHPDGVATETIAEPETTAKKKVSLDTFELHRERIVQRFAESGGFGMVSELKKSLWNRDDLFHEILDAVGASRFVVRKKKAARRTTYYVLRDAIEAFRRHVRKQGWEIIE